MTKREIGAILMRLREKSGKSREEVAELLGKSVKTVGHWETGYAQPDANTLFLLCTIYDADLSTSFGFSPPKKSPGAAEAAPGEEHMVELYRELNQEGQEKLLDYADDLVASGKYIKSGSNRMDKTKGA